MAVHNYDDLRSHVAHNLECVGYGETYAREIIVDGDLVGHEANYANVAIECLDCNVVLVDFDNPNQEVK